MLCSFYSNFQLSSIRQSAIVRQDIKQYIVVVCWMLTLLETLCERNDPIKKRRWDWLLAFWTFDRYLFGVMLSFMFAVIICFLVECRVGVNWMTIWRRWNILYVNLWKGEMTKYMKYAFNKRWSVHLILNLIGFSLLLIGAKNFLELFSKT